MIGKIVDKFSMGQVVFGVWSGCETQTCTLCSGAGLLVTERGRYTCPACQGGGEHATRRTIHGVETGRITGWFFAQRKEDGDNVEEEYAVHIDGDFFELDKVFLTLAEAEARVARLVEEEKGKEIVMARLDWQGSVC